MMNSNQLLNKAAVCFLAGIATACCLEAYEADALDELPGGTVELKREGSLPAARLTPELGLLNPALAERRALPPWLED